MHTKLTTTLFSLLALGACVDSGDATDVENIPKLSSNSLMPGQILGNTLNQSTLTGGALTLSGLEDTANHRMYLQYMIQCALSPKQTVTSTYLGVPYSYTGSIGLATAWTSRGMTLSESRWVSACVLARANLTGTVVTISMRGESAALATTADETANYNVEEAAFYGNIFDSRPDQTHACNGADQVRVGDTYGDLSLRQCGQPDPNHPGYTPCNFVFDGDCTAQCAPNGDHYSSCVDAGGNTQTEVLTVRLYGTAP